MEGKRQDSTRYMKMAMHGYYFCGIYCEKYTHFFSEQ